MDLRVGGSVRVVMRAPDGSEVRAGGEYTLIDRPSKLAFTWTFDDDPSNEQMIELEFAEQDRVTTVLFVNSKSPTKSAATSSTRAGRPVSTR